MTFAQLSFDFAAQLVRSRRHDFAGEDRAYWRAGMVTSLPCFSTIEGGDLRFTQMLPGVVELIDGGRASVRIYAAPEYGYSLEGYPLHLALAVNVPLHAMGKYGLNTRLLRIVDGGLLATGDAQLAAEVRAGMSGTREREIGMVAA